MKLRAVIETDDKICNECSVFPDCHQCFEEVLKGKSNEYFGKSRLIQVEKVKNDE